MPESCQVPNLDGRSLRRVVIAAAFLAEYFPSRIRYTSVSVPYHIGNGWGGGAVPFITSAVWAATHSLAPTLAYSITLPALAFVAWLFLMPETRKMRIWSTETASAGSP